MKLNEIIDSKVDEAVADNAAENAKELLKGSHAPILIVNRTPPPQDIYDQDYATSSPVARFSPGRTRPMWNQPEVAITHTPVSSLLNSGQSQNTQAAQIIGGVASGVKAPANPTWGAVPNLQVTLKANGPIHLVTSLSVQSNVASDIVSFAFYRDGQQISQIFTHTTASNVNSPSLVSLAMIDSDLLVHGPLNYESYAVFWRAGTGVLSSPGTQRSLFAVNLVPQ